MWVSTMWLMWLSSGRMWLMWLNISRMWLMWLSTTWLMWLAIGSEDGQQKVTLC